MKKISLLLILLLCFSLIGCSSQEASSSSVSSTKETSEQQATSKQQEITQKFEILESKVIGSEYGYINTKFKIKNISDQELTFEGIAIRELDANGDILDTWNSYNQNAVEADLEPGQSVYLELSHDEGEVKSVEITGYTYDTEDETFIEEDFPEKITLELE